MWCRLPTGIGRLRALRFAALSLLVVAFITTLITSHDAHATTGVNQTISFQGRIQYSGGGVVADGNYNIQFKIYQDGAGTSAGNPGGTLKWTESHINNGGTAGVQVKNGYMTVTLGSVTPFGTSVDWNQDTLWLSMNIAGSAAACTTFGTAPCTADGEMLPMQRMTAVPQALNSKAVGGKTADELVQLGQGSQTDSTDNSSIFINKTGSGNLIQLQNSGTDVFSINNSGELVFGSGANRALYVGGAGENQNGNNLTMFGGWGGWGTGSNGGGLFLQGGGAGGTNGNGGDVVITGGSNAGTGTKGNIFLGSSTTGIIQIGDTGLSSGTQTINIGNNNTSGGTTNITIGNESAATSGTTTVQAKDSVVIKTDGTTRATFANDSNTVYFGNGASSITPNDFTIQATNSSADAVNGGSLTLRGGDVTTGNANGGNIVLSGGNGSGTGFSGSVVISTPTFSTVTNDANCYTGSTTVAASCTIAASSINNSAAIMVGFSTTDQTATLPDPAITTAGRVIYIMAADGSKDFTLAINGGGAGNKIAIRQNTTTTMMWNGADWTVAGSASSSALRDIQDSGNGTRSVLVGDGNDTDAATLFTLDKADGAPTLTDSALLGSMYYDTTIGKVQCYEADGWGACSDAPDSYITLSPEYSNAVMHGTDIGTMSSDLCSDTLNINDGSSAQPTICGTNETHNFYKWTSAEITTQSRSIFVTYQLPTNFKEFVSGSTSLLGRTNSSDSTVNYQVYRNNSSTGLTACGSAVSVSTGSQTTWQTGTASGGADPSACSFAAGDSIVFRINASAANDANAYVSNLNFAFSNQ